MEKALFISDKLFLDNKSGFSGGVKLCTSDYLELIKKLFNTEVIEIENKISIISRVKIKLKIDTYLHYDNSDLSTVYSKISDNNIKWIVLNMSNLIGIALRIKEKYPLIKIILLSHGNESGDFLHESTRFGINNGSENLTALKLGKLLIKESTARLSVIDHVMTVSPIEYQLEKWLNSKSVFYIPRTIETNFLEINPTLKKIGFIGDLSHHPNIDAINKICQSMIKNKMTDYEFALIGKPIEAGNEFAKKYNFIKYKGFLTDREVDEEISTWSAFLNLLFYFSRGVSTKLGFALSRGIPVISTEIGTRGYEFKNEKKIISTDNTDELCSYINEYCSNKVKNEVLIDISKESATNCIKMNEIIESIKSKLFI